METKHPTINLLIRKISLLLFGVLISSLCYAQSFPERSTRLVNDYTNKLSSSQVQDLENKLVAFDDSTSTQIAVVIIKSLEGYDVADYAVRLAENWGIGQDKKNNGIMLLASLGDRKVTIQTGYGLEGALPDAIARRIIENEIKPGFSDGDYYRGLDAGTDAIIAYTKGEYKNDNPKKDPRSKGGSAGLVFLIVIVIIILVSRKGGGGGNNGSIIGGRGSASPFWWLLMGSALGNSGRGGSSWGGGGGGWGGSSGGGGFGGFGGGSFGGGGASGSW